jgi:hypothetical protein
VGESSAKNRILLSFSLKDFRRGFSETESDMADWSLLFSIDTNPLVFIIPQLMKSEFLPSILSATWRTLLKHHFPFGFFDPH